MYRQRWIVTLIAMSFLFVVACDDDEAAVDDEEAPQEAPEVEETAEEEEVVDEKPEGPRANETDTPPDEAIGELPEGVGIAAGESAPDVAAVNAEGDDVQLLGLAEESAVLVFFYRGGWCPYCNFQIREMTEAYDEFADRDVLPVAVSVDQQDAAADTSAAYEIPYPVVSDPDLAVHEAFSVTYQAESEEVEKLAEHGMDIEASSGRDHNKYAIPSIFLIDSGGTVQWAHANRDYSIRPSPEQLLSVIDEVLE